MPADQTGFTLIDRRRTDIAHKTLSAPRTIRVFGVHPPSSALESFLALPQVGATQLIWRRKAARSGATVGRKMM
jgi:hypothetical protein